MRVAICGAIGGGKTSLLSCILGVIPKTSGQVRIGGSIAYVPQTAWIQTGSIEENILFGSQPMDRERYTSVIRACLLERDLELLSHGDQTIIGERGINLSGGQKQRVQLARALYQDCDIYLLDDPFSALDAETGNDLFKEYITVALASKTVIFVTHQVEFLPAADLILVLKEGRISQCGDYDSLLKEGTDFSVLVSAHHEAVKTLNNKHTNFAVQDKNTNNNSSRRSSSADPAMEEEEEANNDDDDKRKRGGQEEKKKKKEQLVQEEERERGRVSLKVYLSYMSAAHKGALIPAILLSQAAFQLLEIAGNWWMAWASPQARGDSPKVSNPTVMITVYMALALGSSCFVLARATLVAAFGLAAAQNLFLRMLRRVFRASVSFFDSTPAGRILNRVSSDQTLVDLDIPFRLGSFAATTIQLLGIVVVVAKVAWPVLPVFFPVAAACVWMQKYYIRSSRELVRIVSIRKSPIIHLFGESIAGASTIKAFGREKQFVDRNLHLLDCFSRPYLCSAAAIQWLCFRMGLLSTVVFAFFLALLVAFPHGTVDPSTAGLAVVYGLNLNGRLSRWILSFCKLENKVIAIERIYQYCHITPIEAPLIVHDHRPPPSWPEHGTIQLVGLSIRYKENLPTVLHDISCTFPGGKKVGIVGRTGSGKSTLIQALFRLVEPESGRILIDGVDIARLGLHDLRSRLCIIPQEPTLLEGTVRANLDPLQQHSDDQIWKALDKCQLGELIRRHKDQKIDAPVSENGDNWSVGQRQLLCLGRALLKRAKILVLDEATASVDTATDNVIQAVIRNEFNTCTVVTIAHRIPTVIDSDLVLLLSDGRMAEFGMPKKLLEDESSVFFKLVSEYSSRSTGSSLKED